MLNIDMYHVQRNWLFSCLEDIFQYVLEVKSKCLIQACIYAADRVFGGVSSFSQHTQVKFLLESIRHIIAENCQREFLHIMHYLKMLQTLCPDMGAEEEFIKSLLKIKQSFILFSLLDNEGAAAVCKIMSEFFPEENMLHTFGISRTTTKGRFLAVVKRQIYSFKKLVVKLLTDVEFRSYYFFEEWLDEFGETFHNELKTDLSSYLEKVEEYLLANQSFEQVFESCLEPNQMENPARIHFMKVLLDGDREELPEREIIEILTWMFPDLDFSVLTLPCEGNIDIPGFCRKFPLDKVMDTRWKMIDKDPWDFANFNMMMMSLGPDMKEGSKHSNGNTCCMGESKTFGPVTDVCVENSENENNNPNTSKVCKDKKTEKRVPFKPISVNMMYSKSKNLKRKRGCQNKTPVNTSRLKRQCNRNDKPHKPTSTANDKSVFVNLCKNNVFTKLNHCIPADSTKFALKISVESPQCQTLLMSSSKFFASAGRKRQIMTAQNPQCVKKHESCASEISSDGIHFSDTENTESENESLKFTDETMGLTWISTSLHEKSKRMNTRKICRSLCFKSESSDEHVSESDAEYEEDHQHVGCLKTVHQTIIPDLYQHMDHIHGTKPCTVRLTCLSKSIGAITPTHLEIDGARVAAYDDIETILNESGEFHFTGLSSP